MGTIGSGGMRGLSAAGPLPLLVDGLNRCSLAVLVDGRPRCPLSRVRMISAGGYDGRSMAWYKEWFGEEYLGLYSHRDEQEAEAHVDFVERRLGEGWPRAVLDLACGAGRHTAALRRRGYRTLGVDLSLTLLVHARGLPRVAGDMRCLPFAAARVRC